MKDDHEEEYEEEDSKSEKAVEYEMKLQSMGFQSYHHGAHYRTEWIRGDVKVIEYFNGREWDVEHPFLGREDGRMGSENLDEVLNSFKEAMEWKASEISRSLGYISKSSN